MDRAMVGSQRTCNSDKYPSNLSRLSSRTKPIKGYHARYQDRNSRNPAASTPAFQHAIKPPRFSLSIIYFSLSFSLSFPTRSNNGKVEGRRRRRRRKKNRVGSNVFVFISCHVFRTISKSNVEGGTFVLHRIRVAPRLFAFVSSFLV